MITCENVITDSLPCSWVIANALMKNTWVIIIGKPVTTTAVSMVEALCRFYPENGYKSPEERWIKMPK